MKVRPVGAELFHADGRANGHADRHWRIWESLFATLGT